MNLDELFSIAMGTVAALTLVIGAAVVYVKEHRKR